MDKAGRWCTMQVGGAQCRSVVHNIVLHRSSHKPTQTDRQTRPILLTPSLTREVKILPPKCIKPFSVCAIRGEPLIIVGVSCRDFDLAFFSSQRGTCFFFSCCRCHFLFFSILPDPPPPTMINDSSLRQK